MKHRVYLSSTFPDLGDHRQAAAQALHRVGYQVVDPIDRHLALKTLTDASLLALHHSDIFLGIYATHYGNLLPPHDISLLEHLYIEACQMDMPRFIYLVGSKETWAADYLQTDQRGAGMRMFWDKLQAENPHLRYFSTPQDLADKITFDFARLPISTTTSSRRHLLLGLGLVGFFLVIVLLVGVIIR